MPLHCSVSSPQAGQVRKPTHAAPTARLWTVNELRIPPSKTEDDRNAIQIIPEMSSDAKGRLIQPKHPIEALRTAGEVGDARRGIGRDEITIELGPHLRSEFVGTEHPVGMAGKGVGGEGDFTIGPAEGA